MRYGSLCSGIEAASVAWEPLGWQPAWFAEIEPFPSAVLKHHWPHIPNRGDMSKFKEWPNDPIDLLVGGTPCQSFSVAGLRRGLADPRGNLMLTYLAIANQYRPEWLVWENVPGVLSSNRGRDFATFLNGLAELGYGFAYRILDAQYFGVPQRRRRIFVVGRAGSWQRAAAVLFERESLQGHLGQGGTPQENPAAFIEGSFGTYRQSATGGTLKASGGAGQGGSETLLVVHGRQDPCTDNRAFALDCQHSGNTNVVCIAGNIIGRQHHSGGGTALAQTIAASATPSPPPTATPYPTASRCADSHLPSVSVYRASRPGTRKSRGAANPPPTARTGRVIKPSATVWLCQ